MATEYTVQQPSINRHRAAQSGPLSPVGGYVYIDERLGWQPQLYPVLVFQCASGATFDVLGLDGTTWVPYPFELATGTIKVIRGKWDAIRVTTVATVYVRGDLDWQYWNALPALAAP